MHSAYKHKYFLRVQSTLNYVAGVTVVMHLIGELALPRLFETHDNVSFLKEKSVNLLQVWKSVL